MLCQEGVRRRKRSVDSATLFLFWLLLVLCDIFPFQTLLREGLRLVRAETPSLCILKLFTPPPHIRLALIHLICNQQGEISDVPRFCLFYISFGLELIALILSAMADIPPEAQEVVKKVP